MIRPKRTGLHCLANRSRDCLRHLSPRAVAPYESPRPMVRVVDSAKSTPCRLVALRTEVATRLGQGIGLADHLEYRPKSRRPLISHAQSLGTIPLPHLLPSFAGLKFDVHC
jgi:hypothetical protein